MNKKIYVALFSISCFICFSFHHAFSQAGEWTFMKGDSIGANPGNYGTLGVPSVSNKPPAFYEACEWTDHQGNFWMYGGLNWGTGGSYTSAMWKFDPATNMWTWMQGSMLFSQPAVFGTKGISSPANTPGARAFGNCAFTDTTGNLWLIYGYAGAAGEYNTLWKYDIGTNEWTWMNGDTIQNSTGQFGVQGIPSINNSPPGRTEAVTAWVDSQNNFWTFGGQSTALGGIMNDLWRYSPATNEWTWMNGSMTNSAPSVYGTKGVSSALNNPGARNSYSHWKDAQDHLWFFGGSIGVVGPALSDLWKYDISTNEFTWMSGTNVTGSPGLNGGLCNADTSFYPGARGENKACWTDDCDNFWMMGGTSSSSYIADLWKYTPSTNEWMKVYGTTFGQDTGIYGVMGVSSPLNRPPARNGTSSWKDLNGNFWLYGGYVSRYPYPCMNDLWRYVPDPSCGACAILPPVAQFSADNEICPGTCIDFTNLSSNASGYQWSFPGATPATSTDLNPASVCYSTPGNYDVTLIASGANGIDSLTLLNYITVYPYPAPQGIIQSGDTLFANQGSASYQWYLNGNLINGATDYYFIATLSGDYNVVCTDANNCEVEAAIFDVIAGLPATLSELEGVMVFPNPAGDFLVVTAGFRIKSIAIFNSLAEKVRDEKILLTDNPMKTELDIQSLAGGIYWLEVNEGENTYHIKFLKASCR